MTFYYPDISYYQPNAQILAILRQSGGFLCIRAGFGVGFKDPKFDGWRDRAKDARVLMIYHFPTKIDKYKGSVKANAEYFARLVGKVRPNEVLVLDVEPRSGKWTVAECITYMNTVRKLTGAGPMMLYANQAYISENKLGQLFTATHGWVARYGQPGRDAPKPIFQHASWQHAADGFGKPRVRWAGCSAKADENRVEFTPDQFADNLLGGKPKPQPGSDQEDEVRYPYGNIATGTGAATSVSVYPGIKAIGFTAAIRDPETEVSLFVEVRDTKGYYAQQVKISRNGMKPVVIVRDPPNTHSFMVVRLGADHTVNVPASWDAHS